MPTARRAGACRRKPAQDRTSFLSFSGFFGAPKATDIRRVSAGGLMSIQIALAGFHVEASFKHVHLLVGDGVYKGKLRDLQVYLGGLFGGLNEAEGLVEVSAH